MKSLSNFHRRYGIFYLFFFSIYRLYNIVWDHHWHLHEYCFLWCSLTISNVIIIKTVIFFIFLFFFCYIAYICSLITDTKERSDQTWINLEHEMIYANYKRRVLYHWRRNKTNNIPFTWKCPKVLIICLCKMGIMN